MHWRRNPYRFWRTLAFAAGVISAWAGRHAANPDGISYIEVADAYGRGDWTHAINAYWSPLYSWAIALAKGVFHPTAYWEFACVHVVNFAFYLIALACFERFLKRFLAWLGPASGEGLYRAVGYALFLWAALYGIGVVTLSPDLLVLAIVYLASSLLLDLRMRESGHWTGAVLGLVLGVGYLTKAAMFPVGFLFLACVPWRRLAVPLAVFLATCAPFVIALSLSKGRLTFGDSGRINYAWEISGVRRISHWQGGPAGAGTPVHTTTPLRAHPEVFFFGSGPGGADPLWTDPSYWYEGVRPVLNVRRQAENLALNGASALCTFLMAPGALAAVLLLSFARRRGMRDLWRGWFLLLPCTGAVLLYCVVLMGTRYISAFVTVLALVCLGAARAESVGVAWKRLLAVTCTATLAWAPGGALLVATYADVQELVHWREFVPNREALLAAEARRAGLKNGARVGYIGGTIYAYWLYLAGAEAVVEVPMIADLDCGLTSTIHDNPREIEAFWRADPTVRDEVLRAMRARGAVMVFADRVPSWAPKEGWRRLESTLPGAGELGVTWVYAFDQDGSELNPASASAEVMGERHAQRHH